MHVYSRRNKYALETIHKRRLLGGVGSWGPQKGDLRQGGVDTLILAKEMSIFNAPKFKL